MVGFDGWASFAVLVVDGGCSGCLAAGRKGDQEMVGGALFWLSGLDLARCE